MNAPSVSTTNPAACRLANFILASSIAVFLAASPARAANQTYTDTNGSNLWDLATLNWDASASAWTNGNNAIFGGTGEVVTVDAAITVGDITFNADGYTLNSSGSSLTLANAVNTFTVTTAAHSETISVDIGGVGTALIKAGAGALTLFGNNSYDGGTSINAGLLELGNSAALGTTGPISFGGGTLRLIDATDFSARFSTAASQAIALDTNGQDVTLATALTSVGGSLTKSGAGTLILTNNSSSFNGGLTVQTGGAVSTNLLNSNTVTVNRLGTGSVVVDAGGELNLLIGANGGNSVTYGIGTLGGAGTVTVSTGTASGNVLLGGSLAGFTGVLNVGTGANTGGKLSLTTTTGGTAASAIDVRSRSTLFVTGAVSVTAPITLNGGDTGESFGQLRLEAGGSVTDLILAGDVVSGDFTIGGNSTAGTINGAISETAGTRVLSKGGSGSITLNGVNSYTGGTVIAAGTLQIGNGGTTGSLSTTGAITVNGGVIAFNRSNTVTQGTDFGTVITGAGGVTKAGAGLLILNGSGNTYTGATTVNGGTLQAGSITAFGSTSAVVLANTAGVVLDLNGLSNTIGSLATGGTNGGGVALGAATLTLGGNNTNTTYAGIVSGSGSIVKNGTGIWTVSGASTYAGGIVVNSGAVQVGTSLFAGGVTTSGSLGTGTATFAAGTALQSSGGATVGNALVIDGDINFGSATVQGRLIQGAGINLNGTTPTNGVPGTTRTVTLFKNTTAAGLLTSGLEALAFATQANGPTSIPITNGTLRLVAAPSVTTTFSGVRFSSGAFTGNSGLTIGSRVIAMIVTNDPFAAAKPRLTVETGGYFTLSENTNQRSATVFSLSGAGTVTNLDSNGGISTLTVNGDDTTTFTGLITDGAALNAALTLTTPVSSQVALTKTGNGTLTLTSGVNAYTGVTSITGGILSVGTLANAGQVSDLGSAAAAATNILLNGGSLKYTGGTASIDRGMQTNFTNGGTLEITQAAAILTVTGQLTRNTAGSAGATLNKTGAGTLILGGNDVDNTNLGLTVTGGLAVFAKTGTGRAVNGPLIINGGTVQIASGGSGNQIFDSGSAAGDVTVNSGTFDLNGSSELIPGLAAAAAGGTVKNNGTGTSTLTLGAQNRTAAYAGAIIDDDNASGGVTALTKTGTGAQTLSGTLGYTGATTIEAGTLNVNSALAGGSGVAVVNANGGVTNFGVSQTLSTLNIGAGAVVTLLAVPAPFADQLKDSGSVLSVAAVPEPGALGLLSIGALAMLGRRRRFRFPCC